MKKLGLVGGMGPESTIPYYRDIVYGVQKRINSSFFPPLVIESVNVFEVLRMSDRGEHEQLAAYLMHAITNLAAAGAEFAALTANTPHLVFDALREQSPIPLVSIVETCRDEAVRLGLQRIGLLGTSVTMKGTFFRLPFERAGLEVVIPYSDDVDFIACKIEQELELGLVNPETRTAFLAIIQKMVEEKEIEAVVLGCTELPLLFKDAGPSIPVLDTMDIHIRTLIGMIMDQEG